MRHLTDVPASGVTPLPGHSLRRRIIVGILSIAIVTVVLFAVPLAIAIGRLDRSQQIAKLQTDATRVASLVPDNAVRNGQPVPAAPGSSSLVGIYTPDGHRGGGRGPNASKVAAAAADGRTHHADERGQLAVSVPVPSDRQVVAVVRAYIPLSAIASHSRRSWAAMTLLGLGVLAISTLLARQQARRIATPLERLTAAARDLGDGNFAIAPALSGIREADIAAVALGDTAARLGRLLDRERAFSADASHQLRTPLTGLLLGLESALARADADREGALRDALERGRQLQSTIDDLLAIRRDTEGAAKTLDLEGELTTLIERWRPVVAAEKRQLIAAPMTSLPPVTASAAALRQILDVLLDNALKHGAGTITVSADDRGDAVTVEVADEGPGLCGDPETAFARSSRTTRGHGIGLALARSLAEADGGRLLIRRAAPHPVLALLIPAGETIVAESRGYPPEAGAGSNS
jgi:signal transduction histidine kinase